MTYRFLFLLSVIFLFSTEKGFSADTLQTARISRTVKELHSTLVKPDLNQLEQARVFYDWITGHIKYDVPEGKNPHPNYLRQEPPVVLKNGKAICHGYARLFQDLCTLSGIPCFLVSGYTNDNGNFETGLGHTWNLFMTDEGWHFADPTWGAGGVDDHDRFRHDYMASWFDTPPDSMIVSHYPFDPVYQLLDHPVKPKKWISGNFSDVNEDAISFKDSLEMILQLDSASRESGSAYRMVKFNPGNKMCEDILTANISNMLATSLDYYNKLYKTEYAEKRSAFLKNTSNKERKKSALHILKTVESGYENALNQLDSMQGTVKNANLKNYRTAITNNLASIKKEFQYMNQIR